jgi:hypothetical protein
MRLSAQRGRLSIVRLRSVPETFARLPPKMTVTESREFDELDLAKSNAVGGLALRLEQPSQVINQSYLEYRYGFSADYWERYPAK